MYEQSIKSPDKDDSFMKNFKYYKSNKPKPSLDQVLSAETTTEKVCILKE